MSETTVKTALRDQRILKCIEEAKRTGILIKAKHSGYIWRNKDKIQFDPVFFNVQKTVIENNKYFKYFTARTEEPVFEPIPENRLYYYEISNLDLIPIELNKAFKEPVRFDDNIVLNWQIPTHSNRDYNCPSPDSNVSEEL
jgi:hypothetical protein